MSELENDADDVSLEGVLERLLDSREEELHTALPGRVESYSASEQVADVTPLIRRAIPRTDGGLLYEPMPTIRAVPICWPRAGDWFVHMPLAAGDTVLLVICERDLARWRRTGEAADPVDVRLHDLSHAVAIPGVYPRTRELGDTPADALVIGRGGGATVRVLADGTVILDANNIRLGSASAGEGVPLGDALKTWLDTHTHAYVSPSGPALTTAPTTSTSGTPLSPSPSPSAKVNVE